MATGPMGETSKEVHQVPMKATRSFYIMAKTLEHICYCSTPSSILTNTLGIENGIQIWEEAAPDGDVIM